MLLSDDEIKAVNFVDLNRLDYEVFEVDQSSVMEFARAIEAAILAKLGAMELPEPAGAYKEGSFIAMRNGFPSEMIEMSDAYSAAQLHQAYAQGAAAQLSQEPIALLRKDQKHVILADDLPNYMRGEDRFPTPLYTRREAK